MIIDHYINVDIQLYISISHISTCYINISWGFNQPLPEVTPATIGNPRQAAEQCDESGNAAKIGLPTGESFNGSIASGYIYIIYMGFP
jgi:hypothetical protein